MNDRPTALDRPLRVGLLGCSDIARRRFLPALRRSREAVLAAIASRDPVKTAGLVPDAGRHCTYDELLADQDLDLVYLSLPNHLHEAWSLRALAAGKHVICEKPLGLDPAAIARMLDAAATHGRLLYENLMFLCHPRHARVRELIAAGRIGRVVGLHCVFTFPLPGAGDFRLDPARGGGAGHDLARYPLGTALALLESEPTAFNGITVSRDGLDLALHGAAVTGAGVWFSFAIGFGLPYASRYEVTGECGRILVERAYTPPPEQATTIRLHSITEEETFTVPAADQFACMLAEVCSLLRSGRDFAPIHVRSQQLGRLAAALQEGCRHAR